MSNNHIGLKDLFHPDLQVPASILSRKKLQETKSNLLTPVDSVQKIKMPINLIHMRKDGVSSPLTIHDHNNFNVQQIASEPMLLNTERHDEHMKKDLFKKINKNNDFRKTWFKSSKDAKQRLDKKSSYLQSDPIVSKEYKQGSQRHRKEMKD